MRNHPFWIKDRNIPLLRFIRLKIFFLLGEKKLFVNWIDNLILPIDKDYRGIKANYYFGLWDFDEMAFALHLLNEKDTFIDIGSNIGSYSLIASGICKSKTIAFEPESSTYKKLLENININRLENYIFPRKIALTSEAFCRSHENVLFSKDRDCCNSIVDKNYSGEREYVEVSTLDKENKNLEPTLIKIDVEGNELNILGSAKNTLKNESLLALIIEDQSYKVNIILRENGFSDYNYDPIKKELSSHTKFGRNRLWIRRSKIKLVIDRLKKSKKRNVFGKTI